MDILSLSLAFLLVLSWSGWWCLYMYVSVQRWDDNHLSFIYIPFFIYVCMHVYVCVCVRVVMDNDYRLDDEDSKLGGLGGLGEADEKMAEQVNINTLFNEH